MNQSLLSQNWDIIRDALLARLAAEPAAPPAASSLRRPVQLMVGGADRFKPGTARKMGDLALANVAEYAPDYVTFASAMGLPGSEALPANPAEAAALASHFESGTPALEQADQPGRLAYTVYRQVLTKLESEPVESYCLDFEDGYGVHPDAVEDATAAEAASRTAEGLLAGQLPDRTGIRLKAFETATLGRATRTLDIYLSKLLERSGGQLPRGFFVMLPKTYLAEQVSALAHLLGEMERIHGLAGQAIGIEILLETPEAIVGEIGDLAVSSLVDAANGRCSTVHFGVFDYTSSLGITAAHQRPDHPAGDLARLLIQLSLAGSGVHLSDGPIMALPIAPHRAGAGAELNESQRTENRERVHAAWRACFQGIWHALDLGLYQGWDLHPNQLPARYAANFAFFRRQLPEATSRLSNFVKAVTGATRLGTVFDDRATVRALLNFFRQAYGCGAITQEEVEATGLSPEQIARPVFEDVFGP